MYSPLLQLPSPYWQGVTVNVAKGQNAKGSLVIGPVRDSKHAVALPMYPATPSTYPNGRPAFQKDTTMCWQIGHIASSCGLTDMDLGDPSPAVNTDFRGSPQRSELQSGSGGHHHVTVRDSGLELHDRVQCLGSELLRVEPLSMGYTEFNTSIGFFFAHSLAYNVTGKQYLISANPLNR